MATPTQGTFVSRTKNFDPSLNSFTTTHIVSASTTYNSTGSNFRPTAFYVQAGTDYTLTPVEGGSNLTAGLITGQVYPIALKKIVNGAGTQIVLLR